MTINEEVVRLHHIIRVVDINDITDPCSSIFALNYAKERDLDLVLMNDKPNIPICKIYDVKKKKFESKKKQKVNKTTKTKLKTIQ